jgi:serine/threonine protein kinase
MGKPLKRSLEFESAFTVYTALELLGEGGAGRVYGAASSDGSPVAVKLLSEDRASKDKRRRFKNEIAFLSRNTHQNIVNVIDHGVSRSGRASGPFYVMHRYDCNLRTLIEEGIAPRQVLPLFSQLLDGVEAAHLQKIVHRDLKPENVLVRRANNTLAVADFGVARFTEDLLATNVVTGPSQRLANFAYAAPEQRVPGREVGIAADLYALGLILNELFTREIPQRTDYATIGHIAPEAGFLDPLVSLLLRQNPAERPTSIQAIKQQIQRYEAEAVSLQRLNDLGDQVVPTTTVDDPLATTPPVLVGFDWNDGILTLKLDRAVSSQWIHALRNMGAFSSIMGNAPEDFSIHGNLASTRVSAHSAQQVVNSFKSWLPIATRVLRENLEAAARKAERRRLEELRRQREAEEERLRVLRSIRI